MCIFQLLTRFTCIKFSFLLEGIFLFPIVLFVFNKNGAIRMQYLSVSNRRKILAVTTQPKQLRKDSLKKKIQAWTGFEPMTSAMPVQCSTNWAIKPTGSWSYCEFVIYPWKMNQSWTGFEPMTSAMPVQCSTNWAIKPTGSWSYCEFVIYPWRMN